MSMSMMQNLELNWQTIPQLTLQPGVASAHAHHSEPGPFVSPHTHSNNNATGDLVVVMMVLMMEHQQCAEEECKDRGHIQQQQSQMMMTAMMALSRGCAALAHTHHAGVGDDEADNFWDIVSGGIGKPKDICDYA
jgi:hypothetical protein